ncbi:AAA family ATPase [Streptomyces sp. NPDC059092]|uniref:helix-turn-helix transcriptional regulator n=1 Tax=Streptomyces sp. NPDC059092 TaxID=3346725 RepID=UPI0036B21141
MVLVERAGQTAALHESFEACAQGGGRAVVVRGPVTCGKSSLLREFARTVTHAGKPVFSATGSALEKPTPLGIMRQLFHSAGLKREFDRCVEGDPPPARSGLLEPEAARTFGQGVDPRVVDDACSLLLDRVGDGPALLCVDDVHHADEASLEVLLYLQRRLRCRPVLMALSTVDAAWVTIPRFLAELTKNLPCEPVLLDMLSAEGVAELLREPAGTARAIAYHDASGGNPMLLNAMVRDVATGSGTDEAGFAPVSGSTFRSAVAVCLYRGDPGTLEAARCLSVLEESGSQQLLPGTLGVSAEAADRALDALMTVGLLRKDRTFRHPLAVAAVRETMSARERGTYHWRVAALLQQEGADPSTVATHLVAADTRPAPWAALVMVEAAEEALRDDRPDQAVRYAESALRATAAPEARAAGVSVLVRAKRRTSPSAAASHLPALQKALHEGHLAREGVESLISGLLWQARSDDVLHTLSRLEAEGDEPDPERAAMVDSVRAWLRYVSPSAVDAERDVTHAITGWDGGLRHGRDLPHRAHVALLASLGGEDAERVGTRADDVLQNCESGDPGVEPLLSALLALVYADRLEQAGKWCTRLLALFDSRGMVMLKAVLSSVAAEVALRRGDMPLARTYASEALGLMSRKSWGVMIGYPLGTLVTANTALQAYDEAATVLNRPVPQKMYSTTFGLPYLHARGLHALSTGRPYAALEDFRRCGRLMGDWGLDLPAIVPWRNSVGEAYLALDRVDDAHAMFDEQLTLAGDKSPAVRAACLRLMAKTGKSPDRLPRLQESARLLARSGHLLDLTLTLAELSNEHYARGDSARSRTLGRRAMQIARKCDAQGVASGLLLSEDRFDLVGLLGPDEDPYAALSHAESRVAGLAADGLTNREIGRKLYLSVSTVEQHLTRVFRKLGISRRTELIGLLQQGNGEIHDAALDRAAAQG